MMLARLASAATKKAINVHGLKYTSQRCFLSSTSSQSSEPIVISVELVSGTYVWNHDAEVYWYFDVHDFLSYYS